LAEGLFSDGGGCSKSDRQEEFMDADILDPSAFAAADRDGWVALAGKALKGASFAEALVSKTDDRIAVQPLYDRLADAVPLARSRPDAPWTISQRFDDPDAGRALEQLADDLGNGATGVSIVAGGSASAFGLGVDGQWDGFADRLVEALGDKPISVRLEGGGSPALGERLRDAATKLSGRALHYGIDPFTAAALSGRNTDLDDLPAHFAKLASTRSNGTVLNADGRLIHNAGGRKHRSSPLSPLLLPAICGGWRRPGIRRKTSFPPSASVSPPARTSFRPWPRRGRHG
jgi:methylmalonyl-CoA mutase